MEQSASYYIWGIDNSPYGPVELPMLLDWIAEGRVLADTWVFEKTAGNWGKANQFKELQEHFRLDTEFIQRELTPASLRRIKILANLKDAQLAHLADYMELENVGQHTAVFQQGDVGDAMYLVMGGELRARTMIAGEETVLVTFTTGDFFGDMALFDNGPRSADIIANVDSRLVKISAVNFYRLIREAPALATPFLQATARTLASRIRADNKKLSLVSQQFSSSRG
ncbi:MAG TPA: cyclic nucleotide-binding domain-containing protein [Pseudomonadales bacterium]|nr:cyclic nucleotide-binding domain-containing protein [Pseudomonadales bacterium]